jgi:hypothetical protein
MASSTRTKSIASHPLTHAKEGQITLRWEKQSTAMGECEYAYSGKEVIAVIGKRFENGEWYYSFSNISASVCQYAFTRSTVFGREAAIRAVEESFKLWLEALALRPE